MSCIKSFLYFLPTLAVILTICWLYYLFIIEFCLQTLPKSTKQILFLVLFNLFCVMFLWTFYQTRFADNSSVSAEYKFSDGDHSKLLTFSDEQANLILNKFISKKRLKLYTRRYDGFIRYCKICKLVKPDRTHHCSTCEKCILKMDHHCPWVNNCIGFYNYKQFILLLLYGIILCLFFIGSVMEYVVMFWRDTSANSDKLHLIIGFCAASLLGLLLFCLFMFHINLIIKNETTVESLKDGNFTDHFLTFDLGKCNNFREIFGNKCWLWLLPIHTSVGNGCVFPVRNILHQN